MEHLETIVELIISDNDKELNFKETYRFVKSHPLLRGEWKSLTLDEISILVYSVFFKDYEKVIKNKNHIFFCILVDFDNEETHYNDCEYCGGSGYEDCPECNNGSQECSTCDGDGVVGDDDEKCPNCEGAGDLICYECNGKGSISCAACDGDGSISNGDKMDGYSRLTMAYSPDKKLINRLEEHGEGLTLEFDNEIDTLPLNLMLQIESDSFTMYSEEDFAYDSDFSGEEVFYTIVDKKDRLENVHLPYSF